MNQLHVFDKDDVIKYTMKCYCDDGTHCYYLLRGGFSGHEGHDSHLLYTLSAIQILCIYDSLHVLDLEKTVKCAHIPTDSQIVISSLQTKDGSFMGDKWGEVDVRFSYCAVAALSLLNKLDSNTIDVQKATEFVNQCKNFDGGYGSVPGAESHAGLGTDHPWPISSVLLCWRIIDFGPDGFS